MARKLERTRQSPLLKAISFSTALALRWLRGRSISGKRRVAYLSLAAGLTVFGLLPEVALGQGGGVAHTRIMARSPGTVPADGVSYATISMKLFDVDGAKILGLVEGDFAFDNFGSAVIGGFIDEGNGFYHFTVTNTVVEILNITAEAAGMDLGPFDPIAFVEPLVVTTETLPDWTVGVPLYPGSLAAIGGTAPYSWTAVDAGDLPTGLSVHPDGTFGGTPSASGTYDFEVRVADVYGFTATKPLSIRIHSAPMITIDALLPVGVVGLPYGPEWIEVTGGAAPLNHLVTGGGLPPGITLDLTSGHLTGTPTARGTFDFEVTVTDASGGTATAPFTLVVVDPLRVTTATLPDWTVDAPGYPGSLSAEGGTEPYTWSTEDLGDLPPGLVVNANGTFGGIPTVTGTFDFTVVVTDANGFTASASLSIVIYPEIAAVSDLRLTVESNVATASLGEEVEVVVKVTNHGVGAANDVIVLEGHIATAEGLLKRLTVHRLVRTEVDVDRGTVNPESGEWIIGRLEGKTAATMTVRLIVVEP